MRVIVMGEYGCFPGRGGACSGYLVQAGGLNVLVDAGSGVMSRLQNYIQIDELDAVLLTHLHFDHCGDLALLRYARESLISLGRSMRPLPLFLPETPPEMVSFLLAGQMFEPVFTHDGLNAQKGPLSFTFTRMPHSIESYAITIHAPGGKKIVFSGDTTGSPRLAEAASGADLFVCEATTSGLNETAATGPHLNGRLAAQTALRAGVKQLCLTHFWFESSQPDTLTAAQQIYPAAFLAKSGLEIDL